MNIDEMPEHLKVQWWQAAREYDEKPLLSLRSYELEALRWYYGKLTDWDEQPQSHEENLLWHKQQLKAAQVNAEIWNRAVKRMEACLEKLSG